MFLMWLCTYILEVDPSTVTVDITGQEEIIDRITGFVITTN